MRCVIIQLLSHLAYLTLNSFLKNTTSHSRDVLQAKMSLPTEQKALVIEEGQKLKIVKSPVPELKADHEILVKVIEL